MAGSDDALDSMVEDIATDLEAEDGGADLDSANAAEGDETTAEDEVGSDEAPAAAPVAAPAPVQSGMSPDEVAELRKYADIGRRYSPHQKHIDDAIARALNPPAPQAPAAPPAPDDYETIFGTPEGWEKWKGAAGKSAKEYERAVRAVNDRANKERFAKYDAIEKSNAELKQQVETLLGWATTANDRFAQNPETAKWLDHAIRLANQGVPYADAKKEAQKLAELEAKAAGATPKQAAAVGAAVGKGIVAAARGTPAAAPAKAPRPGPVDEPTLRSGGGRKAPPAREDGERLNFGKGGKAGMRAVEYGLAKAMSGKK